MPSLTATSPSASPVGMKGDPRSPVVKKMMKNPSPGADKIPRGTRHKLTVKPGSGNKKRAAPAQEKAKVHQGIDLANMLNDLVPSEMKAPGKPARHIIEKIQAEAKLAEEGKKISSDFRSMKNEEAKFRHRREGRSARPDPVHSQHATMQPRGRAGKSGNTQAFKEARASMSKA